MDHRTSLQKGTMLPFPGMNCQIEDCIGRGSNAIVYEASYADASSPSLRHRVLLKELFPYEPNGGIRRDETRRICVDPSARELWQLHKDSFERGNAIHLRLLSASPEHLGGNLNTFSMNQTLYTLLDYSGGRSMDKALREEPSPTLEQIIQRMRRMLWALEAFHQQGLLHLDISLDNVLLIGHGPQERVILIDYNSVHEHAELLEKRNLFFSAKEGFAAPEVQTGMAESIGPAADLFSAACVFYALLTGAPPTAFQLSRKHPPTASESPLLADAPPTVKAQAARLLRRGLCALPDKRYATCQEMLEDLQELEDRLTGVGVTHAALWEAGRRSVQRLVRQNPSLAYVQREAELYPLRIQPEGGSSLPAAEYLRLIAQGKPSSLLLGEGGMGKSTVLLRYALESDYSPLQPAVIYLPLMGWRKGESLPILDRILMELHFDAKTSTMADARHGLITLLQSEQQHPVLMLLLDGLNEAPDPSALTEELGRLCALPGLRMVVSSRTSPDGLYLSRACMTPLEDADVSLALEQHGLLAPESPDMQGLLHTPMMLALFVQTAESTHQQVLCRTAEELLQAYLDALCTKAAREAGRAADYQVEVAVKLVLPAIARQLLGAGRPLTEAELYRTVCRCHSVLKGKRLCRAFPQWLGHSREIWDGAQQPEHWYGLMIQELLWRRLGLLVQDERGCFRIRHQLMQEHLALLDADNQRRLRSRRIKTGLIACAVAVLLTGLLLGCYVLWLKPRPYSATQSNLVINASISQYAYYGMMYDTMQNMLDGNNTVESCLTYIESVDVSLSHSAALALEGMKQQGQVIPWSGQSFAIDDGERLMLLAAESQRDYQRYLRALLLVEEGRTSTTSEQFMLRLTAVLEADADMAWLLEQVVCLPHVQGMSEGQRQNMQSALLTVPSTLENRSVNLSHGLEYALEKAAEQQKIARSLLEGLPVMHDPAIVSEEEEPSLWPEIRYSVPEALSPAEGLELLMAHLSPVLDSYEQLYTTQQNTLQAFESYVLQLSYAPLLEARITCDEAVHTLSLAEAPVLSISDESLLALMALGVETDGLESMYSSLAASLQTGQTTVAMYESLLYSAVYQKSQLDTLRNWLAIGQVQLSADMTTQGYMLNALLLSCGDSQAAKEVWDTLPRRWPKLASALPPWESDQDRLVEGIIASLNDYLDAAVNQSYSTIGADTYASEQYSQIVGDNDQEALHDDHMPISDMPFMLPLPDYWSTPDTTRLYADVISEETGLPAFLTLCGHGVELEDYLAYMDFLISAGVPLYRQEGSDEEGWKHTFAIGGEPMVYTWSPTGYAAASCDPGVLSLEGMVYIISTYP